MPRFSASNYALSNRLCRSSSLSKSNDPSRDAVRHHGPGRGQVSGQARVTSQQLVPAFMGNNGCQGEIAIIRITLECLCINDKHILIRSHTQAELGATGVAISVPVFEAPYEAQSASNLEDPSLLEFLRNKGAKFMPVNR